MEKDKYEIEQDLRIELLKQEIELRKSETLRSHELRDARIAERQEGYHLAWVRHVAHVERVNRFHMTAGVFQVIALFLIAWGIINR